MKKTLLVILMLLPTTSPAHTVADVNLHYDANHCELYVNSFGVGDFYYNSDRMKVLDVEINVNQHDLVDLESSQILAVGVRSLERVISIGMGEKDQPVLKVDERTIDIEAEHFIEGIYRIRYKFEQERKDAKEFVEIKGVAFYADVLRADRSIVRLWQRFRGSWFRFEDIINMQSAIKYSTGTGIFHYPYADSPVYYQRSSCT